MSNKLHGCRDCRNYFRLDSTYIYECEGELYNENMKTILQQYKMYIQLLNWQLYGCSLWMYGLMAIMASIFYN